MKLKIVRRDCEKYPGLADNGYETGGRGNREADDLDSFVEQDLL